MMRTSLLPELKPLVEAHAESSVDAAIFIRSLHGGGAERVLLNLANALAAQGLKIDILLARREGAYLKQVSPDVRIVDLASQQVMRSLFPLTRYLKQVRPDCLLAALHYPTELAILAKRIARVKTRIVVVEQNTLSLESKGIPQLSVRLTPLAARLFYPYADRIIAASQGVADDLAQITHLPSEKIDVIYNPVLTPDLPEKAKEAVSHPWFETGEPPVILAVGRLHQQKDYPTLIHAFAQLQQQRSVRLMILGTGPDEASLKQLVEQMGLTEAVAFPGFVANPYAYMAKASVFVLSSAWEGFGNVLVEAMASGTAIVSTDCQSGPSEVLDRGAYGLLVPVGDRQAMAKAILQALLEGPRPAPERWLHQFTPEVCLQKYAAVMGLTDVSFTDRLEAHLEQSHVKA